MNSLDLRRRVRDVEQDKRAIERADKAATNKMMPGFTLTKSITWLILFLSTFHPLEVSALIGKPQPSAPTSTSKRNNSNNSRNNTSKKESMASSAKMIGPQFLKLGPFQLQTKAPPAFSWKASVDRATGLASATETSELPPNSPLFRHINSPHCDLLRTCQTLFGSYGSWLCSGRVTGGLLRAVPRSGGGVELVDRLFGLPWLILGRPHGNRIAYTLLMQHTHCIWTIPITGGILSSAASSKNGGTRGKVVFTLNQATEENVPETRCHLKTELVDYAPAVVGTKTPSNLLRTSLYMGTQSVVHGYVMWRFHMRCRNLTSEQLEKIDNSQSKI